MDNERGDILGFVGKPKVAVEPVQSPVDNPSVESNENIWAVGQRRPGSSGRRGFLSSLGFAERTQYDTTGDTQVSPDGKKQLQHDEGLRLEPYLDTEKHWTIGTGFNLDVPENASLFEKVVGVSAKNAIKNGTKITKAQNDTLFEQATQQASADAKRVVSNYDKLPVAVQDALTNMAFNLGGAGLAGFKKAIKAIEAGDGHAAYKELLDSRWAEQVGARADRLAATIRDSLENK